MPLGRVFQWICAKVINPNEIIMFREDVAMTFCMLEMVMPPYFFNVMTHLVIHLFEEIDLCSPIHIRWMYRIKKMNKVLKGYVQCMRQLEGCMAESYTMEESTGFLKEYMQKFMPISPRMWDVEEKKAISGEVLEGARKLVDLGQVLQDVAHQYVLINTSTMATWVRY
jgi:hypothetical protein